MEFTEIINLFYPFTFLWNSMKSQLNALHILKKFLLLSWRPDEIFSPIFSIKKLYFYSFLPGRMVRRGRGSQEGDSMSAAAPPGSWMGWRRGRWWRQRGRGWRWSSWSPTENNNIITLRNVNCQLLSWAKITQQKKMLEVVQFSNISVTLLTHFPNN